MELIEMYVKAHGDAAVVIGRIEPDQMTLPTSCAGWDVRTLLNHFINTCYAFADRLDGKEPDVGGESPDFAGNDPAGAWKLASDKVVTAWTQPGVLERTMTLPIGEVPAQIGLGIHFNEVLSHTWDLAKATGQNPDYDPELYAAALAFAEMGLSDDLRGPGGPFQARVDVADDAPIHDRHAAFLGRQP
jgi:uncharacterized protein (TIGR03086 family)